MPVHRAYRVPLPARVSFSGGRTSGYMLYHLIKAFGGSLPENLIVTFANTGREDEATLEFVEECSKRWNVEIWWLEYKRDTTKPIIKWRGNQPDNGQHSWCHVDFATANRKGEPFEQLIDCLIDYRKAKGEVPILPNVVQRICSAQLKQRTMDRFMEYLGYRRFTSVVGLRADEPQRVFQLLGCATSRKDFVCPLHDAKVDVNKVLDFWSHQPFYLKLKNDPCMGTYEGNCDFCFLKRTDKIKRLARERPAAVEWWANQEKKTGSNFRRGRFTYTDILEGKVPLDVISNEQDEMGTCFCHE